MILHKKSALVTLGRFLAQFSTANATFDDNLPQNDRFFDAFHQVLQAASHANGWFTPEQLAFACKNWSEALTLENLDRWLEPYRLPVSEPKTVALVLAGNIPLVGFHDFIAVWLSGHKALVRRSSNDAALLPFLTDYLSALSPDYQPNHSFTEAPLKGFDAVIATGSNNTSRYFEYYFRDKPSIIRRNRNSVAVLSGNETPEQLLALGRDIFTYFGLGCRNVSKLYVPENYDFEPFFGAMYAFRDIIDLKKYENNYDYNKAVFLMSKFKLRDNGFLILKEDASYASPIASLFYETYAHPDQVWRRIQADEHLLQCVVSAMPIPGSIPFGTTQEPELWDYADNVDTMKFLSEL